MGQGIEEARLQIMFLAAISLFLLPLVPCLENVVQNILEESQGRRLREEGGQKRLAN